VFTVQLVRNFLACLSGIAKFNTPALKDTGNMSILMRSSQKPGARGRLLRRWQAGDGGCQAPVSRLPGSETSQGFLAAGLPSQPLSPGSALERASGWPACSVKSSGLPTSTLQERHRFLPLYIFLLFWNEIWSRLVYLAGFLLPCFFNSEFPRAQEEQVLVIP